MTLHRLSAATIATAAALAVSAPSAVAQYLPDDNSAFDQYVASLPEPGGDRPVGTDDASPGRPLPRDVSRRLASTAGGRALRDVATSPALGAPRADRAGSGRVARPPALKRIVRPVADEEGPSMAGAVIGSGPGVLTLLLLAGVLAAGAAWAASGARSTRRA